VARASRPWITRQMRVPLQTKRSGRLRLQLATAYNERPGSNRFLLAFLLIWPGPSRLQT
jgi:hypothetical protein